MRSRMASARVGSSSHACQAVTGNWLVMSVARLPTLSSNNSSKSLRSCAAMGAMAKSSNYVERNITRRPSTESHYCERAQCFAVSARWPSDHACNYHQFPGAGRTTEKETKKPAAAVTHLAVIHVDNARSSRHLNGIAVRDRWNTHACRCGTFNWFTLIARINGRVGHRR